MINFIVGIISTIHCCYYYYYYEGFKSITETDTEITFETRFIKKERLIHPFYVPYAMQHTQEKEERSGAWERKKNELSICVCILRL